MKKALTFWILVAVVIIACFEVIDAHAGGVTIGLVSKHYGGGDYNEINPGVCLDSGFMRFRIACAYIDSDKEEALALAIGVRKPIAPKLYLGATTGLIFKGEYNPDLLVAGLITYGTEKTSATIMLSPKQDDTPAVAYLTLRTNY
jgi:hypothetical protein